MTAVGQHHLGQQGGDAGQRAVDQLVAGGPGERGAGDPRGHRALEPPFGMVAQAKQMPRLSGQVGQHQGGFRLAGGGQQHARGAGEVIDPPLQHIGAPGEAVEPPKRAPPIQHQAQALARAGLALGQQVAQPVHAVQRNGEAARGAGPVPRVALGADA